MKITIVFAVLVVILASDLVFGQQRYLSRDPMKLYDDYGDKISETTDTIDDLAETRRTYEYGDNFYP